ncbi:MAG: serine protease [Cyanobacteria bacterium J06649_11]
MHWWKWKFIGSFGCLSLVLSVSSLFCNRLSARSTNNGCENEVSFTKQSSIPISEKQLRHRAEMISVKVMGDEIIGTGFLLRKKGCVYTVVTNAHVLRAGKAPYRVQTSDHRTWKAQVRYVASEGGDDLAILQFRSKGEVYTVPSIGVQPIAGTEVVAAGFPVVEGATRVRFRLTAGQVSLVLNKALQGGYQIGYTNDIQKGMSGGALLNRRGEVVAVNGMHAFPLWDIPSVFETGEEADKALHDQIVRLSWAVPIKRVEEVRRQKEEEEN